MNYTEMISDVEVYGLEKSIKASKYPMAVNIEKGDYIEKCLKYYKNILKIKKELSVLKNLELFDDYFAFDFDGRQILLSYEDYKLALGNLTYGGSYVKSDGEHIHKLILNEEGKYTDHINKNIYDNRRYNLRLCEPKENCRNSNLYKNNTSSVMGVSWRKDRKKWRAYISPDNKQISLGMFENFDDAVIARLNAELEYFGEYSPQFNLMKQYGLINEDIHSEKKISALVALTYLERMKTLASAKAGSGHDNALKGIVVQFDLTMTCKMSVELERYHFIDFISSQSTMHKIAKFDLDTSYIKYVDKRIIEIMKEKVEEYNKLSNALIPQDLESTIKHNDMLKEKYLEILYSNPCGFRLTARMTTNYQQLKTIYSQRKTHRLPEWRAFCDWIETLPYAKEFILENKEAK